MNPTIRIATYNIFLRLERWEERLPLIIEELDQIDADIICLQEVVLPRNTAEEIEAGLKHKYHVNYVSRYYDGTQDTIALAILSKKKPTEISQLALGSSEKRIAMRATFKAGVKEFDVINTHLYWKPYHPFHKTIRLLQVSRLISWAQSDRDVLICGDMNATPRSNVMRYFYHRGYRSGFNAVHKKEPEWTCANPVGNPDRTKFEQAILIIYNMLQKNRLGQWRDVIDYILCTKNWRIARADIFGDQPSKIDPTLYPSDHRGIYIDAKIPLWRSKP